MNKPIKKAPIRDQIYDIIKKNIIEGKYEPGSRLSITALSKELNVSNSPVREALSMLNRDGIIDIYPAFEICQQTGRMDQLVELLQKTLKAQIDHLEVDNMQEYVRYSISFESAFITCCDNPYITRQYGQIEDLFYMIVLYNHWHIDRSRNHTVMEHQQILSAIISGDYSTAKDLLSAHYNRFQLNETN